MDLSGHDRFRPSAGQDARAQATGESLLAIGWTALASGRAESLDIHLGSGLQVTGALAIRIGGGIAEAATRAGEFTHAFAVDDVVMVRQNRRGARPGA
ncbi:hypothetical protein ACUJ46_06640 [Sandaracinobacteroides sp. A072]|uniref:hypothetical protein n=1 Tax=Sandaracinobacteroides sp. A072 TaxID=3461146 RepID=UPI00404156BE